MPILRPRCFVHHRSEVLAEDSPGSANWDQAKLNFAFEQQARADNIQGVVENAHTQGPRSISQWRKGAVTKRRDFDWNYVFFDKPTAIIQVRIHDRRRRVLISVRRSPRSIVCHIEPCLKISVALIVLIYRNKSDEDFRRVP